MRIAQVLAGISLAEADVLRKRRRQEGRRAHPHWSWASSRRKPSPAVIHANIIADIAAQIETFGRYGFPKGHSVAYSMISYQTAWLKTHHPADFMAALLSSQIGDTDAVVKYINEARELELEVLPPDVNESGYQVHGHRRSPHPVRAGRRPQRRAVCDRLDQRGPG